MQNDRSRHHRRRASRVGALCALAALALPGCHTMRFEIMDAPHTRVVHHQKNFFVAGLFPRLQQVDVSQYCPHGVARVREQTTSDDALKSALTLGMWTPRSSWYYCLPGPGEGAGWVVDVPIPGEPDEGAPGADAEPADDDGGAS